MLATSTAHIQTCAATSIRAVWVRLLRHASVLVIAAVILMCLYFGVSTVE